MLVSNIRRTITDEERDQVIVEFAERLANSGPFRNLQFVKADPERAATDVLVTAGLDTAHTSRLIVLDPAQYSLRNGMEKDTVAALTVAMGLGTGTEQLPVQWASSAVYAIVNAQRRALARRVAVEYLARQKALAAPRFRATTSSDPPARRSSQAQEINWRRRSSTHTSTSLTWHSPTRTENGTSIRSSSTMNIVVRLMAPSCGRP